MSLMNMLAPITTGVVLAAVGVLVLPIASDIASAAFVASRRLGVRPRNGHQPSRLLFLIPAHNEARGIASCVRSVLALRYPRDLIRVIVIADNCEDDTAAVARASGAQCLERHDLTLRGKPRAIAWALERLDVSSYDGVVILDADAVVHADYAAALDAAGPLRGKACECYDDVRNPGDSALTRMAAVLSAGRFRGSFRLKHAAGINVPLSDGLCVGSDVLRDHPWNAFGLCEDWELYAQLTALGIRTELVPDARLFAMETRTLRQSESQRRRWLSGKLGVLWREGPRILASDRIRWRQKLDALAELSAPGPAVHLGVAAVCAALVVIAGAPAQNVLLWGLGVSLVRPAFYAVIGLREDTDPWRALASFTYLPVYTCWRLVVAAASVWPARHRPWIRTARD